MFNWFRKQEEIRLVGMVHIGVEETDRFTKKKTEHHVSIALYMTDSGKRSFRILPGPSEFIEKWVKSSECKDYQQVLVWAEGGNFPKNLEYFEDPLKEMLMRMVDDKVKGGQ